VRTGLGIEELKGVYARIAGRYDIQHALLTAYSDRRGRTLLVESAVQPGNNVLDCGSGTGATGILAAKKVGPEGKVVLFDLSDAMLDVARRKVLESGLQAKIEFHTGDMVHLPFDDGEFDVVLSTYSLCPLYDPEQGALELYRATAPGGRIGVAHSTEPANPIVRWLADRIENVAWRFPSLSMGCRSVEVLPALKSAGGKVVFSRVIGVPLWPFRVFVIQKPVA
jgi:demethylmenaquinone methyltransferase / 2-methoxy-6-polyprenyl-1,4-benzoquinol methylase